MKALLLKDWYMAVKYCKAYLVIVAVFAAVAMSGANFMYGFYACIMAGMVPVTLLSYDERSKWTVYSCALPYTRAQLVSVKYIVGGLAQLAVIILLTAIQCVRSGFSGGFDFGVLLEYMSLQIFMSCLVCSVNLPFVFKYGVEKGRAWYYIALVLVFGVAGALAGIFVLSDTSRHGILGAFALVPAIAGIVIYALSWRLSIRFYEKREM